MNELRVNVAVNSTKVASGLNSAKNDVKKWAGEMKGTVAAAFGGLAIAGAVKKSLDGIQNMGDAADGMGRTITEVQVLTQMAKLAGKELSNVEMMLNNIAEAQIDALGGNEDKLATFQGLGISREQLANSNNLQVSQMMAKGAQGKSAMEMRNMGVSDVVGKKSMSTFLSMQDDLADFANILHKKVAEGKTVSELDAQKFKDSTDDLSASLHDLGVQLSRNLLPAVTALVKGFNTLLLYITTLWKTIGSFLGGASVGNGKEGNKTVKALAGTTPVGAFIYELFNSGKDRLEHGMAEAGKVLESGIEDFQQIWSDDKSTKHVKDANELSKLGPGEPRNKTKALAEELTHFAMPDRVANKNFGLSSDPYSSRGGLGGINLGLLSSIRQTNDLLKKIEQNTRERNATSAVNSQMDIIGMMLGISVK